MLRSAAIGLTLTLLPAAGHAGLTDFDQTAELVATAICIGVHTDASYNQAWDQGTPKARAKGLTVDRIEAVKANQGVEAIQDRANEMIRDVGCQALIPEQAYAVFGPYKPLGPSSFDGFYD
tara:strand:- start:15 stop:377 length:363 start_codon:yes stop_codon:yes gene_type:complete